MWYERPPTNTMTRATAIVTTMTPTGPIVTAGSTAAPMPDFVPPQVTIQTEAPGMSPEDVEELVTRPVETMLMGAGSQESIRSETIQGLSVITVVFKEGHVFRGPIRITDKYHYVIVILWLHWSAFFFQ